MNFGIELNKINLKFTFPNQLIPCALFSGHLPLTFEMNTRCILSYPFTRQYYLTKGKVRPKHRKHLLFFDLEQNGTDQTIVFSV